MRQSNEQILVIGHGVTKKNYFHYLLIDSMSFFGSLFHTKKPLGSFGAGNVRSLFR